VVGHAVSVSAPALAQPGQTATVRTTFTNTGAGAVQNVAMGLNLPSSWTATATTPADFATVTAGQQVSFEATVLWNGTQVGKHSGGLLPFEVDVTTRSPGTRRTPCTCWSDPARRGPAGRRLALPERLVVEPDLLGHLAGRVAARPLRDVRAGQLRHDVGDGQTDLRHDHAGQRLTTPATCRSSTR
jgi:hypothetical protein